MSSYDSTRWKQNIANITVPTTSETIRIGYITCSPPISATKKGTILLIHGFPQTSYQFRHVITPLSDAGYQVVAPDYRGAGKSSKPHSGYTKTQMAEDLHTLLHTHLNIEGKVHVVGHDIGGMIAWPYASRYPDDVASLIWGECPLPGTSLYEEVKTMTDVFHFVFHQVLDLPEALIAGREDIYVRHFFDKQSARSFYSKEDLDTYVQDYKQPGAIRAGLEVYRAFEKDAEENREALKTKGKLAVPTMGMFGEKFLLKDRGGEMLAEVCGEGAEQCFIEGAGHYVAEEEPGKFVQGVLAFVNKHNS